MYRTSPDEAIMVRSCGVMKPSVKRQRSEGGDMLFLLMEEISDAANIPDDDIRTSIR